MLCTCRLAHDFVGSQWAELGKPFKHFSEESANLPRSAVQVSCATSNHNSDGAGGDSVALPPGDLNGTCPSRDTTMCPISYNAMRLQLFFEEGWQKETIFYVWWATIVL